MQLPPPGGEWLHGCILLASVPAAGYKIPRESAFLRCLSLGIFCLSSHLPAQEAEPALAGVGLQNLPTIPAEVVRHLFRPIIDDAGAEE